MTNFFSITRSINYLKALSLIIVVWFMAVFNLERLDVEGVPIVNLPNSTYVTIILIGLLFLLLPNLESMNFLIVLGGFMAVELVMQALLEWKAFAPKIILIQLALNAVTIFLMRQLSANLQKVEEGMDSISLTSESFHMLKYEEAAQRTDEEIHSLQQRQRPMTMLYCMLSSNDSSFLNLPPSEDIVNQNMNQMFEFRTRQVELARHIMGLTHVGDIIFEYRNGIVVCLLESDQAEAEKFIYRLHRFVRHYKRFTLWVGMGVYPDDGHTFVDLLNITLSSLRVYERDEDEALNSSVISGDVRVGLRERLHIELASEWVNKLVYQSTTSRSIYRPLKRAIDIFGSGLILLLISPLLLVIAFFVYITDGRPLFYTQERVGLGGKEFKMYKFRSMYRDSQPLEPVVVTLPDGTIREDFPEKTEDDPRVTRIGRIIRKWSLDELPQLWNVFIGDMSLVGPRPSSWGLEKHTLLQTSRLTVKPGITGLWQVSARDVKNFDERLLWDLKYVQKLSLWLDMLILFRTAGAVLRKTGI